MTVHDLLHSLTSRELTEWQAYERITGPLGPQRVDLQAAIIAATVANSVGGSKSTPADFIPKWDRRAASPDELFRKVQQLNQALGGEAT